MSTDRPDKTESPFTVPAGHVQVELDLARLTRDRDGNAETETLNIAPINLKFGLDNRTDLQIVYDAYLHETALDRQTNTRTRRSGVGDLTIRLKHNLWGNDGSTTALAIMPFVNIPLGSNGFERRLVEGGVIVPLAVDLGSGFGLGVMTEIDLIGAESDNGRVVSFVNSATIGVDVTDRLGFYAEVFSEKRAERGADWVLTGDFGLTYALSDYVQLDGGANIGLTAAADDLNLFIGLSMRF